MDEYITKEAVIQAFEWGDVDVFEDCGDGYISGFSRDAIKNTINSIPAADVTPVVHGRWIMHDDEFGLTCECSVCHIETMGDGNYCPNCGCRMDGGDNDANKEIN